MMREGNGRKNGKLCLGRPEAEIMKHQTRVHSNAWHQKEVRRGGAVLLGIGDEAELKHGKCHLLQG